MINVDSKDRIGKPLQIRHFIPWVNLKSALARTTSQYSLPVAIELDKLKEGGFLSEAVECAAVYHQNHRRDYFSYVITQEEKYGAVYLSIFCAGKSKNLHNKNAAEIMEKNRQAQANLYHATHGEYGYVGSGVSRTINSWVSKNAEKKLVDEELYYNRLADALFDAIEVALNMPAPAAQPAPQYKTQEKSQSAPQQQAKQAPKTNHSYDSAKSSGKSAGQARKQPQSSGVLSAEERYRQNGYSQQELDKLRKKKHSVTPPPQPTYTTQSQPYRMVSSKASRSASQNTKEQSAEALHYFICAKCGQRFKTHKAAGTLHVTCPGCGNAFEHKW